MDQPLAHPAGLNLPVSMSIIDLAIQRVAGLDEQLATKLLAWLDRAAPRRVSPDRCNTARV